MGLNPTGQVVLELEKSVEGKVSLGEEFIYELQPGETAELKPLSVRTEFEELEDKEVKVKIEGNKVVVTTGYSEKEKGYGEEFLGDDIIEVPIDLSSLGLEVEEGDLSIKLVYGEEEILTIDSSLGEEGVVVDEPPEELEESEELVEDLNETLGNQTQGNETGGNETNQIQIGLNGTNQIFEISSVESLTIQEKALLFDYFGNKGYSKSEMFKDRIIITYTLGRYEVEFSYDSSISEELLKIVMENDRVHWLRDLSVSLHSSESSREELNITNESFDL